MSCTILHILCEGQTEERFSFLEDKLMGDIGCRAFIPYIQLHEFEALLFVDISKLEIEYPLSKDNGSVTF